MPQMFPIMWTFMFIMTSLTLLVILSLIFYKAKPTTTFKSNLNTQIHPIWQW